MAQATRPDFITCARCGAEKAVGRRGPMPTYCSPECRAALKHERSRKDGRYEQSLAESRRHTHENRQAAARPCPYCEAPMLHPRRVQCGQPACKRRFNAERMLEWQRGYKAASGQWYHRNYSAQQRAYHERARHTRGSWRDLYPGCAAASDARRRVLVQRARTDEVFAPLDVHTRDQWTCQLCWEPIDPGVAWPDRMSPSIDHVMPLSRGGLHAMANVQSAHLGCNSSKGDRLTSELTFDLGVGLEIK